METLDAVVLRKRMRKEFRQPEVCRYWPSKPCYATADAASTALRSYWNKLVSEYRRHDGLYVDRCPAGGERGWHWHIGRKQALEHAADRSGLAGEE